jgi:DNA-binding MarR family transcriptional regulator
MAMASPVDDERLTLAGLLFEANAGLVNELSKRLETESGLSTQWFGVMLRLARSPGQRLRMTDLAAQLTLTSSGLTRVVDRLEEAGYVRRETCPSDRRGSYAALTPSGKRKIESALPKHLDDLDECFISLLTDRERRDLEKALRKVRDAVYPQGLVNGPRAAC